MSRPIKVSVVIAAYNLGRYLPATLDSLERQTHRDVEIIVCDDGSTDDTPQVVARYPAIYIRQENHGCCGAARNTALRHATGEYIAFIDADDLAHPERFAWQVEFLEAHPNVGAVYTNFVNFKITNKTDVHVLGADHYAGCPKIRSRLTGGTAVLGPADARDVLLEENFALPSTCMIRREVLTTVPGFATVKGGEDILFAYQVAQRWSIGLLDMIGAWRRVHDSNVSGGSNPFPYMAGQIRSREMMAAIEESPELRKRLAAWIKMRRRQMARAYADRGAFRESLSAGFAARDAVNVLRTLLLSVVRP